MSAARIGTLASLLLALGAEALLSAPKPTPITLLYGGKQSTTDSFEVVSKLPPCSLKPFTSGEMRTKLGGKLLKPRPGEKPSSFLNIPVPPGHVPIVIPIFKDEQLEVVYPDGKRIAFLKYLDLLNKYEQLVCELGLSMRVKDPYEKTILKVPPVLLALKQKPLAPSLVQAEPGTPAGDSPPLPEPMACTPEEELAFIQWGQNGPLNAYKIEPVPGSLAQRFYFVTDTGICFDEMILFASPQLCGIDPEGGFSTCQVPEETETTVPGTVAGNGASLLPCLYGGSLAGSWTGAKRCLGGKSGGNGWFGFEVCATFDSELSFTEEDGRFHTQLGQGISASAILFDKAIEIFSVGATGEREFFQGSGWTNEPEPASQVAVLGVPTSLPQVSQEIAGPQAWFLVGPVPVSVTSGLSLSLDPAKPTVAATLPGQSCAAGSEGSVALGIGPSLKVAANVKAGVDVLVLSAKVVGELVLAEDALAVSTPVTIRPATNEVTIAPAVTLDYHHLGGSLYLQFKVDFLVVSESWKIELFSFEGLHDQTTLAFEPIQFSSF